MSCLPFALCTLKNVEASWMDKITPRVNWEGKPSRVMKAGFLEEKGYH